MDLLSLTENAFRFLQERYGFDPPSLEIESRDQYDYVLFRRKALDIAVVFWPPQLPSVVFTQYPSGMSAPEGLPYSKTLVVEPKGRYPFHKAATRMLTGRWIRRRQKAELEREVEQSVQELAEQVRLDYQALLEALAKQEV